MAARAAVQPGLHARPDTIVLFGTCGMTASSLVRRRQAILDELLRLATERKRSRETTESNYTVRVKTAKRDLEEARQQILAEYEAERATLERHYAETRGVLAERFEAEYGASGREYQAICERITATYEAQRARIKKDHGEARWELQAVYDAKRPLPRREFKELQRQVEARLDQVRQLNEAVEQWLLDVRQPREPASGETAQPAGSGEPLQEPGKRLAELIAAAEEAADRLRRLFVPSLFKGTGPLVLVIGMTVLAIFPSGWLSGWDVTWVTASSMAAMVASVALMIWLYALARRQVSRRFEIWAAALADTENHARRWTSDALAHCRRRQRELRRGFEADVKEADARFERLRAECRARRDQEQHQADQKYLPLLKELKERFEQQTRDLDEERPRRLAELDRRHDERLAALEQGDRRRREEYDAQHEADLAATAERWRTGLKRLAFETAEINRECHQRFARWDDPSWEGWTPPYDVPAAVSFGRFVIGVDQLPGANERRPRDDETPADFSLPALLSFPDCGSVLLKTGGAGRIEAVTALQSIMLRYLTALPPGKVRFTIIDPVGLGQNFAGFMHLADHDEKLVSNRIWTEPQFIEQRLADITAHMANVIQKYLRNEFETIEDYNRHAGEVAEPYRIVVVANFPFSFTDAAARHLLSIASSGARCGVYTLVSADMKQRMPQGFNLADLEQHAVKLVWKDGRFTFKAGIWDNVPLDLDPPPPSERFTRLVQQVGEAAKDASRVEVPFEFIAPPAERWWAADSRGGIDVALGRAGATKRQRLQLGHGTSQHVLIAGKTGSGKSTLLHALVTNLALTYSPDEVELYLVDFKKGVEFKTYATHKLPHARVVAIESEREFGLSVLQRLDRELKQRGDAFRDAGAQDVAAYREATGQPAPRILLIVDEFQEFFVEDDKIAQEAALLLDRLVRQGRAFGIHVHLGSQTLGGAYSLARSTVGQMAVRIALQCSEADAHLILAEDNPAARLLARPGEAIYNDANGRVEGNHLFQVVWLSEERREHYLGRVAELARQRSYAPPQPQIVFEGNVPAELAKNHLLADLLAAETWPAAPQMQAWIGEAIAIKDPTAVHFRRQGGSHLLLIGQQAEAALSILAAAQLSLAAQLSCDDAAGASAARFYVLDGSPPDSPHVGCFQRLAAALPHATQVGGVRDAAAIIDEVAAEVARRQQSADLDLPELFVMIYDLQRFRELRRAEDDFAFSREEKPSPARQLVTILREGPTVGVHVLAWCDTLNNLQRTFDRQTLREFENRVLFQMNQADSSNLIDSPLASRLGMHRGLLYSEELGQLEKFRPYSPPPAELLDAVRRRLGTRSVGSGAALRPPAEGAETR